MERGFSVRNIYAESTLNNTLCVRWGYTLYTLQMGGGTEYQNTRSWVRRQYGSAGVVRVCRHLSAGYTCAIGPFVCQSLCAASVHEPEVNCPGECVCCKYVINTGT
jgi:hypothetical protein